MRRKAKTASGQPRIRLAMVTCRNWDRSKRGELTSRRQANDREVSESGRAGGRRQDGDGLILSLSRRSWMSRAATNGRKLDEKRLVAEQKEL